MAKKITDKQKEMIKKMQDFLATDIGQDGGITLDSDLTSIWGLKKIYYNATGVYLSGDQGKKDRINFADIHLVFRNARSQDDDFKAFLDAPDPVDDIRISLKASLAEMTKALAEPAKDTPNQYIVVVEGLPVDPEIIDNRLTGKATSGMPHTVRRFNARIAQRIAAKTKNSNNTQGLAVAWHMATREQITKIKKSLEFLSA